MQAPTRNEKLLANVKNEPYFTGNNFVLYQSDCLSILNQLPDNSVDMVFADPPYNLSNDGFSVHAGKRVSVNKGDWDKSKGFEDDLSFHMEWIEACKRILKPSGTIWISGTYHSIYQCGYALQQLGYKLLNDIAWYKPNASPNLSCRYFTASHETLLWARKDPNAQHTYNYEEMKHGDWHKDDFIKKPGKQMRSVWSAHTPKSEEKIYGKHPTQKPLSLLDRIVSSSTNPDEIIVDPFTGSSTTGISAARLNRKFIGIDTEGEYLDVSTKRYKDIQTEIDL